ncbi:phage tail protein [Photorhabdus sp. S8-52]|nr:phage tail protein [Photorhabdus sp. S9-53]RAW93817.1 phage tail protein [Photorhabdus sp. S10-54]RAW96932.1 phage tail protein [Photorhabdus sp. S8-52]
MWPHVQVNQVNQLQSEIEEIERVLLFVGMGKTNTGKTIVVNTQTDFDSVLRTAETALKRHVLAAMANAGQNWSGYIHVLPESTDELAFVEAVTSAQRIASIEGYVLTVGATKAMIKAAQTLRANTMAKFGRWQWAILAVDGTQAKETWADYVTRLAELQKGEAVASVQLVPCLWGNEAGVLAGRLCNRAVTVADSPARVQTGALMDLGSTDFPKDGTGQPIDLATLQALEKLRFSVPMWYPDYDGMYWSDGRTLDVEGGDYQSIENLRVVDKVAHRVRLQAIAKIADRSLNSTPGSVATHQAYFARTLREMSGSTEINGVTFPGEVKSPKDEDVVMTWRNKNTVEIYITVRIYECPKGISVSLLLGSSLEKTA